MRYTRLLTLTLLSAGAPALAGAQATTPRAEGTREPMIWRSDEPEHRAALGIGTSATGTARDTLGVMVTSVTRGSPAEKAGIEEGNRISAINGVSLRASAADVEDMQYSGTLTHRLTRELSKVKPGDEVELRVYREGRTSSVKVRTADSDSLFRRREVRMTRGDMDDRPALGFSIGSSGSRRDTLGVLVIGVPDSTPASRAGLEEGNRIAAINGVNLRVAREDAGDPMLGGVKAQRLQREIAQLNPGSDVTLRVYANGQFRDVHLKVARLADLPRHRGGMMIMGGMEPVPPIPPSGPTGTIMRAPRAPGEGHNIHIDLGPEIRAQMQVLRASLERMGPEFERMRPEIERALQELPSMMDRIVVPDVRVDVDVDADGTSKLAPVLGRATSM